MKILVIGDPHGRLPKKIPKADLILITGDIGKADFARKFFFKNIERKKKGLEELEYGSAESKKVWMEIHNSTMNILNKLSKIAPTYSILGNVGTNMIKESVRKKDEEKYKIKLPSFRKGIYNIKDFHLVQNRLRVVNGLRIGFLEYFIDACWDKEFGTKDKKKIKKAKKETEKAKRILKNFRDLDILVCHQPPYGILDKVTGKFGAPKNWHGKHAGSKVILNYIKKHQPHYVFCGHIHEAKGMKKVGKTKVYNVGFNGDYVLIDID